MNQQTQAAKVAELNEAAARSLQLLEDHEAKWGTDEATMPAGQRERYQRLQNGLKRASAALEDETARGDRLDAIRTAAMDPRNREAGFGAGIPEAATIRQRTNPWNPGAGDDFARMDSAAGLATRALDAAAYAPGFHDAARALLTSVVEGDDDPRASALVLAGTDPSYRSAFSKVVKDPQHGHMLWTPAEREAYARTETARTALSLTDGAGGFLVPFTLDPTVILTNAASRNPIRELARVVTTATGTWNGVASAGVTAEWLAEGAVAADANPAFSRVEIPTFKGGAWLYGSYEILADSNVGEQLAALIADARTNAENAAFATGNGTTEPTGIVTAATGTVSSTTAGVFGLSDVYLVQEALTPRARLGRSPAFVANNAVLNMIRYFDSSTGGSSLWTDLGQSTPVSLLGLRLAECSGMTPTIATNAIPLIAGDFAQFQIVDRLGTVVVHDPLVMDATSGRPTGQAGWFAYWRTGSDVLDAGAFKALKIK